jgi:NAD(P)-dependent dehydrogenase (short-subunit alcohol dehydrogenase family)
MNLNGKKFLITGAASGLGRATSLMLSSYGAELLLIDRNVEDLRQVAQMTSGVGNALVCDLLTCEWGVVKSWILDRCKDVGLDGFVHFAGVPCTVPIKHLSVERYEKVNKVNVSSIIEMTKIFISKNILSRNNPSVVLISSVSGLVGFTPNVAYSMTKGAIISMTRALAIELASKGIRVNCVAPGFIKTPLMEQTADMLGDDYESNLSAMHPLGLGTTVDVANAVAFLLSDYSKWITGVVLPVDGGYTAQ